MMKYDHLTDVTLVCDDKQQFKAHKIILSACSSVFKSIINNLPQNNSVIYLRGIQHQEMESILEFMYLGVATLNQEQMNEFLNVAKSLELKEISKDVEFHSDVGKEEPEVSDFDSTNYIMPEVAEKNINDTNAERNMMQNSQLQKNEEGIFDCDQCQRQFTKMNSLKTHIQSIHEGVKYACDQCEYQATYQKNLIRHVQSKHEGVKYSCHKCDYQASFKSGLAYHVLSKHEGVKYACNQCDFQATQQSALKLHIQSMHEGIKYACSQCDYQATQRGHLKTHIQSKH